jgi:hypothetical protein
MENGTTPMSNPFNRPLTDHRGRPANLMPASQLPTWFSAEARRAMLRTFRTNPRDVMQRMSVAGVVLIGTSIATAITIRRGVDFGLLLAMTCVFLIVGVLPISLLTLLRGNRHRARAVQACTRDGACPACGYDLRPCPREAGACTICPECGAAWKLVKPI